MNQSPSDELRGKWRGVLTSAGIPEQSLDGKHHPCPVSGDGKDRFRFSNTDGEGRYFCACSNGGDGLELLQCLRRCDFKSALQYARDAAGVKREEPVQKRAPLPALRAVSKARVKLGVKVRLYLSSRGISEVPAKLFEGRTSYGLGEVGITAQQLAMIAPFHDPAGKLVTFHLTYIDENSRKAQHSRARVMMTPACKISGGAVRLFPAAAEMGVAEGIETALSAAHIHGLPVWAALNANMMEQFVPPPECKRLVVFGDHDINFRGQAAAYACAHKAQVLHKIESEVMVPSTQGWDWNDVLLGRH